MLNRNIVFTPKICNFVANYRISIRTCKTKTRLSYELLDWYNNTRSKYRTVNYNEKCIAIRESSDVEVVRIQTSSWGVDGCRRRWSEM